jgi:hypothetical protein
MFTLDNLFLLLTGLLAAYLCWYFWKRYGLNKALHNLYYLMGFAVLLVSGLLLIFLGLGILASPLVLTVASLIPLGISMGLAEEYFPSWKKYFKWFALIGFLAIAITSIGGMDLLKKIAVPLFHGVAGLVIFLGPFFAKGAPKGFFWVGIGGVLIGLGGIALAFISMGAQLLFFSPAFVMMILTPLLLLMTGAFTLGFTKKG